MHVNKLGKTNGVSKAPLVCGTTFLHLRFKSLIASSKDVSNVSPLLIRKHHVRTIAKTA